MAELHGHLKTCVQDTCTLNKVDKKSTYLGSRVVAYRPRQRQMGTHTVLHWHPTSEVPKGTRASAFIGPELYGTSSLRQHVPPYQ